MEATVTHCFADLDRQDVEVDMETALCKPFDSPEQIWLFVTIMLGDRKKAVGLGISPILWTIATRGSMSTKQYKSARYFLCFANRRWRALEAFIAGDSELFGYAVEHGYDKL